MQKFNDFPTNRFLATIRRMVDFLLDENNSDELKEKHFDSNMAIVQECVGEVVFYKKYQKLITDGKKENL